LHGHTTDTILGPFTLSPTGLQTGFSSYVIQWQKEKQVLVWPVKTATGSAVFPHPGWM